MGVQKLELTMKERDEEQHKQKQLMELTKDAIEAMQVGDAIRCCKTR
jgi:hypothetical protein